MKKMIRICAAVVVLCLISTLFVGCGPNAAKPFLGVWYVYKVSSPSNEIVFSDLAAIAKIEMTVEFTSDGQYEIHYYVAGKEGENYPQTGKYEMDGEKIMLIEDDGYGEIVNGELILYFEDGAVKQYCKANP